MKLYCQPGACSTSDHIVLEWAGAQYELQKVTREYKRTPEYIALNPAGAVPTLVDGDFVLTQNVAIHGYIADTHPGSGLFGDGSARQRAEAARWLEYVSSDLHPAFKPMFAPARFGGQGEEGEAQIRDAARTNVAQTLELAEQRLADREWLAGFRSPADAYLYITLRWASNAGIPLGANLTAHLDRMERDEQVQKVLADEGLEPVSDQAAAAA